MPLTLGSRISLAKPRQNGYGSSTMRLPLSPTRCAPSQAQTSTQQALLLEKGFAPYQAERVVRELERRGGDATSAEWLQGRVDALVKVVGPGPHINTLIYNGGLDLLDRDTSQFPAQLVALKEALPGVDVMDVVSKEPRLLWLADPGPTLSKVITKLTAIWPYKSSSKKQDVLKTVQEYPELLVRMPYYSSDPKIKRVEDLPVDLQNRILRNYCG